MELNKHSFPVKITLEDAISIFQKEFDKKGHKVKINRENLHLNLTPFWVCFFDIDCKNDGKYQHISAQTALNSLTNKIQDEFLKLLEVSTPQIIDSIDVSLEKVEIRVKKSLIKLEEAKETITKMLACKYSVDKANISLSGFEEMYIPIWRCNFENLELYSDGVIGKINNFEKIDKRQKGSNEIFSEMLEDIKSPKMFFKYFINLFSWIFKVIIKNWYLVVIMVIIIVIAFLVLF
jgi:hypothetical protein